MENKRRLAAQPAANPPQYPNRTGHDLTMRADMTLAWPSGQVREHVVLCISGYDQEPWRDKQTDGLVIDHKKEKEKTVKMDKEKGIQEKCVLRKMEDDREYDKQTTEEIKEDIRQQMKSEESIDFRLDLEVPLFKHNMHLSTFSTKSSV